MAYMLPLRFIQISETVSLCATRIVAMMSTQSYQARRTIAEEKKNQTLINGCGTQPACTAIFLDNGSVVSSPYTVERLMKVIEKSNLKSDRSKYKPRRLRVYDAVDDEPNDNMKQCEEISALLEDEEDDFEETDGEDIDD